MKRRSFLGIVLATLSALFTWALPTPAPDPDLRKVFRWTGERWQQVRMRELKVSDWFVLQDKQALPGVTDVIWEVEELPYTRHDGSWGVVASSRSTFPVDSGLPLRAA